MDPRDHVERNGPGHGHGHGMGMGMGTGNISTNQGMGMGTGKRGWPVGPGRRRAVAMARNIWDSSMCRREVGLELRKAMARDIWNNSMCRREVGLELGAIDDDVTVDASRPVMDMAVGMGVAVWPEAAVADVHGS